MCQQVNYGKTYCLSGSPPSGTTKWIKANIYGDTGSALLKHEAPYVRPASLLVASEGCLLCPSVSTITGPEGSNLDRTLSLTESNSYSPSVYLSPLFLIVFIPALHSLGSSFASSCTPYQMDYLTCWVWCQCVYTARVTLTLGLIRWHYVCLLSIDRFSILHYNADHLQNPRNWSFYVCRECSGSILVQSDISYACSILHQTVAGSFPVQYVGKVLGKALKTDRSKCNLILNWIMYASQSWFRPIVKLFVVLLKSYPWSPFQ